MTDNDKPSTALARVDQTTLVLRPIADGNTLFAAREEIQAAIIDRLIIGVDLVYQGKDPTRGKPGEKPALSKAGGEKIRGGMGCVVTYRIDEQEIDHDRRNTFWNKWERTEETSFGLYRYRVAAAVKTRDGLLLAERLGVCSSMESKYINRPRDCEHVALSMAQKRAGVAATLEAFGLSDRFTVDLDEKSHDEPEGTRPARAATKHRTEPAPTTTIDRSGSNKPAPRAPIPRHIDTDDGPLAEVHTFMGRVDASVTPEELRALFDEWIAKAKAMGETLGIGTRWAMRAYFDRAKLGDKWAPSDDAAAMVELLRTSRVQAAMETHAVEREPSGPMSTAPTIDADFDEQGGAA